MIDQSTPRGRIAAAAMDLAGQRPWADVTLADIARAANVSLADLRKSYGAKAQIVAAIMRGIDDAVLAKSDLQSDQAKRDQIFEVIMARFDAMLPHKPAIKSIASAGMLDPSLLMPFLNSQRWMLAAAGVDADGAGGFIRTAGLGAAYLQVFEIWIKDDDPGMSRTMAALDQRLRRGERTLGTLDSFVGGISRVATDLPGLVRSVFDRRRSPPDQPQGDRGA